MASNFVPALAGLRRPLGMQNARGRAFFGITRGPLLHISPAQPIGSDRLSGLWCAWRPWKKIAASQPPNSGRWWVHFQNNFLMQFQADLLNWRNQANLDHWNNAIGAAFLAGISLWNFREIKEGIKSLWMLIEVSLPTWKKETIEKNLLHFWHKAIDRSKNLDRD